MFKSYIICNIVIEVMNIYIYNLKYKNKVYVYIKKNYNIRIKILNIKVKVINICKNFEYNNKKMNIFIEILNIKVKVFQRFFIRRYYKYIFMIYRVNFNDFEGEFRYWIEILVKLL